MPRALTGAATTVVALVLSLSAPSTALAEENRPPDRPDTASLTARGEACSTDPAAPTLLNDTSLTLKGLFPDPDRALGSVQVSGEFEWAREGEVEPLGQVVTTAAWQYPDQEPAPQSATAHDLPEEALFGYRARGHDGQSAGEWSERCWVEISTSRPANPPAVTSEDYPDDGRFHGGPGQSGEFTFSGNGVEDAAAYSYGTSGSCATRVEPETLGGTATVTLTPERDGPTDLHARTIDPYGNSSACERVHSFNVAPVSGPVAAFTFDEGGGASTADAAASGRTATAQADLEWTRGRVGSATYRLEDTAAVVTGNPLRTEQAVVDTSGAFTLSVWARLDDASDDAVLLSQEGDATSGFQLGYDAGEDRWTFRQSAGDTPGARFVHEVRSQEPARTGVWTQLVATQDPATGRTELYVDGVHQGGADHVSAWHAEGAFVIGGGLAPRRTELGWPGAVDHVLVWDRALSDEVLFPTDTERSEVWEQANRPLSPQASWRLDEASGETAADRTDHGLDATLHGDPATVWNADFDDWFEPVVVLDGAASEHLRTDGPAVQTGHSFTVSAVVRLDDLTRDAVAVSQGGDHAGAFALGYAADSGTWIFETAAEDAAGAAVHRVSSTVSAQEGAWVHLVGVHDLTDGTLSLYVDSEPVATADAGRPWNAGGDVVVGAAAAGGDTDRYWSGGLRLVQILQGVPTRSDVGVLVF